MRDITFRIDETDPLQRLLADVLDNLPRGARGGSLAQLLLSYAKTKSLDTNMDSKILAGFILVEANVAQNKPCIKRAKRPKTTKKELKKKNEKEVNTPEYTVTQEAEEISIKTKPKTERKTAKSQKLTETEKDRIVTLYNDDYKITTIAKETGVSEATVYRVLRERR